MLRGQLDKFVFTQFLIGAPQDAVVRLFLWAVVWLSFVAGPLLLLLGFLLQFLPYRSIPVTCVQEVMLLLDFAMLLLLWPRITRADPQQVRVLSVRVGDLVATEPVLMTKRRHLRNAGLSCVLLAGMSVFVAVMSWRGLVLEHERLVEPDEDKLSKLAMTLSLRGRDLQSGHFAGTDFRKADLSRANLANADLRDARLDEARLREADLSRADLYGVSLRGADLSGATLEGARNLTQAQLEQACGADAKLPPDLTLLEPCPSQ
jgi:hypothetical protein